MSFQADHLPKNYLSPFKILVPGITSLKSSQGSAPSDYLHCDSIPALHSPQSDVPPRAHQEARNLDNPVGRQTRSTPPRAHLEASAATGPRALLRLSFQSFLAGHLPEYLRLSFFSSPLLIPGGPPATVKYTSGSRDSRGEIRCTILLDPGRCQQPAALARLPTCCPGKAPNLLVLAKRQQPAALARPQPAKFHFTLFLCAGF